MHVFNEELGILLNMMHPPPPKKKILIILFFNTYALKSLLRLLTSLLVSLVLRILISFCFYAMKVVIL